jgi:hypothetical protein
MILFANRIYHQRGERIMAQTVLPFQYEKDLAGGKLPSGLFGANAAWWQIMILAFNLNSAMKRLVLGESWVNRRMKAIRLWLINVAGRVLEHGRQLFVRLAGGDVRRTRYSLKHEGGWFACAIRVKIRPGEKLRLGGVSYESEGIAR